MMEPFIRWLADKPLSPQAAFARNHRSFDTLYMGIQDHYQEERQALLQEIMLLWETWKKETWRQHDQPILFACRLCSRVFWGCKDDAETCMLACGEAVFFLHMSCVSAFCPTMIGALMLYPVVLLLQYKPCFQVLPGLSRRTQERIMAYFDHDPHADEEAAV